MTERTYKKDLEILTHIFRQFCSGNSFSLSSELNLLEQLMYSQALDPIQQFHAQFLKDLEIRLFYWTDKNNSANQTNVCEEASKIGDLLNNLNVVLKYYDIYLDKYDDILNELESACKNKSKRFEALFKDFESQKVCYLPFTMFLIKPLQRLVHYKLLFERNYILTCCKKI
jgi:FERM/RhoGEF/pleckstrin domain protein 2